jgi:hypothetical protein
MVNLKARVFGVGMNMEEYIPTHCVAGIEKLGSQLPIMEIKNLILNIVVLVLTQI